MADVRVEPTILRLSEVVASGRGIERVYQRFADKVSIAPSGCWMWTGSLVWGYGQLYYDRRPWKAHRVSWTLFRGPIPRDLNVLHHCDTTGCVNPNHLFLGDQYDNHQDMTRKGRARVGRGSRHGNAVLTETRVTAALLLLMDGVDVAPIARCLGVSIQAISAVRDGRSWTHVARPVPVADESEEIATKSAYNRARHGRRQKATAA
jgi:hypothetical protein